MDHVTVVGDVAVLGSGVLAAGIAEVAARAGTAVRIIDPDSDAAERALGAIRTSLEQEHSRGRLNEREVAEISGRIRTGGSLAQVVPCALVIEALNADLATTGAVLRDVEEAVGQGVGREVMLATTTSTLSVTALAARLRHPGLLLGLHFFAPVPRMSLVEVVQADATEPKLLDAACDLVRAWGKTPVQCRATPGFVVDRISRSFFGEGQRLIEAGLDPATVDAILREVGGFPQGPFELSDLQGQDHDLELTRRLWEQTFHDPRYAPTVWQQRLVDAGRVGRRAGRGVYAYTPDGELLDARPLTSPPRTPPAVVQLVEYDFGPMAPFLDRVAAGGVRIERVELSDDEVMDELPGLRLPGEGLLRVTDGSTARSWSLEAAGGVVLLDWAHDPAHCHRVALMAARDVDPRVLDSAIGLCQAAGVEVSVIPDVAGGVVARTVSMLVNEAVDLVARQEASATDVDVAMLLGTGYPSGPLEWGDQVGAIRVAAVLGELADETPTGRYRLSPRLDEAIVAEENLRDL